MDPRILIVDDMPAVRSIVRNMLEEIGWKNVMEAEDGSLAWDAIREVAQDSARRFDLVIADWNMPEMSGVDLLRTVRGYAHTRHLPFVMITSQGDQNHVGTAARAGVTDYLVKPFNSQQLRDLVHRVLSSASSA